MSIDERSAGKIKTLRDKAQPWFTELYERLNAHLNPLGLKAIVTSGNRTFAEQNDLFAQGRTKPGSIVTKARGGFSNHNYGIAVDVTIFRGTNPIFESPHYRELGKIGKALGLTWGGDWVSINDEPHFEINTGLKIRALRERQRSGGWSAVDALIPEFTGKKPPRPTPTDEVLPKTTVLLDNPDDAAPATRIDLDAWFDGSSNWVSVSDFVDFFGGEVVEGEGTAARYRLHAESVPITLKTIQGFTTARFSWDGRTRTLTVHR
jgi:hypothetical protein